MTTSTAGETLTLIFTRFAAIAAKWREQIETEHQQDAAHAAVADSDDPYAAIFTDEQP